MHILVIEPSNQLDITLDRYSEKLDNVTTYFGLEDMIPNAIIRGIVRVLYSPKMNKYIKIPRFKMKLRYDDAINEIDDSIIIVINAHMYYWLDKLCFFNRTRCKKNKLVLLFSDKVELFVDTYGYDIRQLSSKLDLLITYNEADAEKYNLSFAAPVVRDFTCSDNDSIEMKRDIDVFFIGSEKGRENIINSIYDKCVERGMKCEFYLINSKSTNHRNGIHYLTSTLRYEEVLKIARRSKAILNILQEGSSGITVRDSEAYSFGSYIITNNKSEKLKEIFSEGQIINIECEYWEKALDKIVYSNRRFGKKSNMYDRKKFFDKISKELAKD